MTTGKKSDQLNLTRKVIQTLKLNISLLLFISISQTATCQRFSFVYTEIGLGSNWGIDPNVTVAILDTTLIYSYYEGVKTYAWVRPTGDTVWKHVLTPHQISIDKKTIQNIVGIIKDLKGKSIAASNPLIMSGVIQKLYFEFDNSCLEFSLKNTADSIATSVIKLINKHLPEKRKIYVFFDPDLPEVNFAPLISTCPDDTKKTYEDYLKDDYKIIMKSNN